VGIYGCENPATVHVCKDNIFTIIEILHYNGYDCFFGLIYDLKYGKKITANGAFVQVILSHQRSKMCWLSNQVLEFF
jgi:hypothetical protein